MGLIGIENWQPARRHRRPLMVVPPCAKTRFPYPPMNVNFSLSQSLCILLNRSAALTSRSFIPKMMRGFVPERLLYQALQILALASDSFVWPLKNRDAVGQIEPFRHAPVLQRTSL